MAPQKWTSERNEQLMLLFVDEVNLNKEKKEELCKKWKERYPDDDFQPTARAISDQIGILKKKSKNANGGGGGGSLSTPKSTSKANGAVRQTPSSGVKRAAAKTPTGSNKRARKSKMSDDEDDDDGNQVETDEVANEDLANMPKRTTPARRAVANRNKSYLESDNEDDVGNGDEDFLTSASKPSSIYGANDSVVDSPTTTLAQHGGRSSKARSKLDPPKFNDFEAAIKAEAEDSDKDLL